MTETMQTGQETCANEVSRCPAHRCAEERPELDAADELVFPMHKRAVAQYSTDESGTVELHLYYGDKEISFDEPELFAFGESLAKSSRFIAGSAVEWGEGYDWPRVRALLEQLIEEGILRHAETEDAISVSAEDAARPSPLPPAVCRTPRTWRECADITLELTGRRLEYGYLELVVPVFRIAHIALDAEGRQVGESNVFPKPLRLDIPTDWRVCPHSGSRYRDDKPMNVTALKSMRAHWASMTTALARIRETYLRRYPAARERWTVGDLERLAALVLAIPTYRLTKAEGYAENGTLHPVLSNLFRVADGLRMTTHQMMFVPGVEAALSPDAPMTGEELYAYAERNYSFHSTHGVCAGPRSMIEEFLGVLIDGKSPAHSDDLEPEAQAALDDIEAAFDYCLYGLQAHFAVFSLWPAMTRAYDRLWHIVEAWPESGPAKLWKLREHLSGKREILQNRTYHATEEWRVQRERAYASLFEQCARGLGEVSPRALPDLIAPPADARAEELQARLSTLLHRRFSGDFIATSHVIGNLAVCLSRYCLQAQAILAVACEIQGKINALLGRTPPKRPFYAADIDIHVLLQGEEARRLPYLLDELEEMLDFRVEIAHDRIEIHDRMA